MVKLARTLDFQVVAEQVEDQASFEALRTLGVDFVQGFVIEKPRPLTPSTSPPAAAARAAHGRELVIVREICYSATAMHRSFYARRSRGRSPRGGFGSERRNDRSSVVGSCAARCASCIACT